MTRLTCLSGLIAGVLLACGCGGAANDGLPVQGAVTLDGSPLAHATVTFLPQGNTQGHGGTGKTDATGRYEVTTPYGKKGLVPGDYKVVVSRRLNPDGSVPPPDDKPIESQAKESLPARYSLESSTELKFTLAPGEKKAADFALRSGR